MQGCLYDTPLLTADEVLEFQLFPMRKNLAPLSTSDRHMASFASLCGRRNSEQTDVLIEANTTKGTSVYAE